MQSAGSDWLLKIGPLFGQNVASTRKQAEQGVTVKLLETAKPMLVTTAPLKPQLLEGIVCSSGCGAPEITEVAPEVEVFSYELPNGHWFSQGVVQPFGYKVVCKRA